MYGLDMSRREKSRHLNNAIITRSLVKKARACEPRITIPRVRAWKYSLRMWEYGNNCEEKARIQDPNVIKTL